MKKTCEYCGESFKAKRSSARFCQPTHRARFNEKSETPPKKIDYGIPPLEFLPYPALKIPKNKATLIYGSEGTGKSTLALNIARDCLRAGMSVLYLDCEDALDNDRLAALEMPQDIQIRRLHYIEEVYDVLTDESVADYDLVIIDSLSGATFRTEEETEAGAANIGIKARVINKIFRQLPHYRFPVTTIFFNQERPNISSYGQMYPPGGLGQMYGSHHILRATTTSKDKFQQNKQIVGHWINLEVRKSRFMSPHQKFRIRLTYKGDITND